MSRLIIKFLFCVSIFLIVSSCTAYKKIPYIKDAETLSQEQLTSSASTYEAKIMPNDVLSITVNSQTPGLATEFNLSLLPVGSNEVAQKSYNSASAGAGTMQNYIVNKNGSIEFPILGTIDIGGLTRVQLEQKLIKLIYPKYITEKPIVNVRFYNYKVAVIGEVMKPGIYTSENNVMTLFDALALAGDLTIYGKRNNIKIVRENEKGELAVLVVDLQDKNTLLDKNVYYLQQNDKIIVEPNKTRGNASSFGAIETVALSAVSILISVIAIIVK